MLLEAIKNGENKEIEFKRELRESSKKGVRLLGIIAMMKENENISATEIADNLGVTSRTIKRDIDYLKEMNVVKREGTAQSGKWIAAE